MGLGHALEGAGLLLVAGGAVDLAIDLSLLCQQGARPRVALVLEVIAQAGERIPIDEIEPATIGDSLVSRELTSVMLPLPCAPIPGRPAARAVKERRSGILKPAPWCPCQSGGCKG